VVLAAVVQAQQADRQAQRYHEAVLADKPVAYWRLNELGGSSAVANAAREADATGEWLQGRVVGRVDLGRPGPQPGQYVDFESDNAAAAFGGKNTYIKVADPGPKSDLDFGQGDSLTLEAWVSLNQIEEGRQIYIVGKGRTGRTGFAPENQNYALRLRGTPDGGTSTAAVSFLFRDQDNRPAGDPKTAEDWHRWTSHSGFLEGTGWHHVAVTYTFGQPKSIRAYIDGLEVEGTWDMGGPSDQPPVVDEDELWIGSSMGGSAASALDGLIDEVAIYRAALTAEQIRRHVNIVAPERDVPLLTAKPGEVLVEILEGLPDKRTWDFPPPRVTEQYLQQALALVGVPNKYSHKAVVIDRSSPFMVRATGQIDLPAGEYRFLLRSRGAARLFIDDKLLLETAFPPVNSSGHEDVPELPAAVEPGLRPMQVGHREQLKPLSLDGRPHVFRLETIVGERGLRPELGELSVSYARNGEPLRLLSAKLNLPLTDEGWTAYAADQHARLAEMSRKSRRTAGAEEHKYWQWRHELARQFWQDRPPVHIPDPSATGVPPVKSGTGVPPVSHRRDAGATMHNDIDRFINHALAQAKVEPAPLCDDATFLRRLTLDTVGVIPTPEEIAAFLNDATPGRRARAIERLLADDRWADHWVGYWQDVLAENPGLLKPQLNNTGPFRFWIYESFADNKPLDRFVTELVMMEGSRLGGGPAGFAMATQNDAPMAAKAQILAKAFLGVEMQCARCHDAPYHPFKQQDTFSLAAMLGKGPQKVPETSTVKFVEGARKPLVEVTLSPGSSVAPNWPFEHMVPGELPEGVLRERNNPREELAAILTSPANERFAQVMVNRLWRRWMGRGLVEPVDDWTDARPSHPELLDYLARELVTHSYDLQHVARLILNSHAYQRTVVESEGDDADEARRLFATPTRRRLSAEQLVDSLFLAAGKQFHCEELNLDPDCRRPRADFLNLGVPQRAWQFASLSNERDRPALALPVAQGVLDLLVTFGWRESRQNAITVRDTEPTVLQPLVLANGTVGSRIARLSDDSRITELCLEDRPLEELVQAVFQHVLSRAATADEEQLFVELLAEGFENRRVISPGDSAKPKADKRTTVSWSNHLSPEATRIKLELERAARAGDPPTTRLQADWRERMEDALWSLINSPEFAFVP
jgi:hypothetical protein